MEKEVLMWPHPLPPRNEYLRLDIRNIINPGNNPLSLLLQGTIDNSGNESAAGDRGSWQSSHNIQSGIQSLKYISTDEINFITDSASHPNTPRNPFQTQHFNILPSTY
jgi:hypothetical protein